MFKCDDCSKITRPRQKEIRKIVAKREKEYKLTDEKGRPLTDRDGNQRITQGWEIVKEIRVCGECNLTQRPLPTTSA
jgi:hypothetical protein